jgi:hypothetical protein
MLFQIQMPMRIRIQQIQGFDDQKFTAETFYIYIFFITKHTIYLSLDLPKGGPSYREAFSPPNSSEHPAFQNMKILHFFLFLWVIFALLDPDPDPATQTNVDPDADPDPQPCDKESMSSSKSS